MDLLYGMVSKFPSAIWIAHVLLLSSMMDSSLRAAFSGMIIVPSTL
jgi:hypothetical protein